MNIYDFDNTIIKGDSSIKFIRYSLIHHPILVIHCFLKAIKEKFKRSDFEIVKGELFSFVKKINNLDEYMDNFSSKYMKNIKKFYLNNQKDTDVVISASFLFIVKSFCDKLGIKNVIATNYDPNTGKTIGKNCKGKEKIIRFYKEFKDPVVNEAYSDSLSDIPMFEIAKSAYLVKGEDLILYESSQK